MPLTCCHTALPLRPAGAAPPTTCPAPPAPPTCCWRARHSSCGAPTTPTPTTATRITTSRQPAPAGRRVSWFEGAGGGACWRRLRGCGMAASCAPAKCQAPPVWHCLLFADTVWAPLLNPAPGGASASGKRQRASSDAQRPRTDWQKKDEHTWLKVVPPWWCEHRTVHFASE